MVQKTTSPRPLNVWAENWYADYSCPREREHQLCVHEKKCMMENVRVCVNE